MIEFSVLLPICSKEKVKEVKECLDSILNQTLLPNEIVIIKDGKLPPSLDKYINNFYHKNKEIVYVYSFEENRGLGAALKDGIELCKYPYIARMDADDICVKDRFEKQVNYLEKNQVDVLGGWIEEYDSEMVTKIGTREVPTDEKEILKKGKYRTTFNHTTVMLKKQKVLDVGNYENVAIEDYILWTKMFINKAKVHNLKDILVKVRTSDDMYKRRRGKQYIKKIVSMEKRLLDMRYINVFQYIYNISIRTCIAILPVKIVKIVYKKILRTK